MIKLVLAGGEPSHSSKKVQIEIILTVGKDFCLLEKKKQKNTDIIIPRCGDLIFPSSVTVLIHKKYCCI